MTMKSPSYKRGTIFNIQRISEKIIENHFLYRICFTTLSRHLNLDSIKLILVRLLLLIRWAIWPMALLLHVVFPLDTRFACNATMQSVCKSCVLWYYCYLFNTVVCVQLEEHFLYSILKNIFLRFWHLTNINFWKIIVYLLCWVMGATPVTSLLSSLKINHLYLSHFTQMERNMFTANTVLSDCIFGGLKPILDYT